MGKMTKMIPVPGIGIIYIRDIDYKKISYRFQYYNSKVFFDDCVDIVEVEGGILLLTLSNRVIIPYSPEELRNKLSNENAKNYFN